VLFSANTSQTFPGIFHGGNVGESRTVDDGEEILKMSLPLVFFIRCSQVVTVHVARTTVVVVVAMETTASLKTAETMEVVATGHMEVTR
jgi:hypothetical protein